MRRYASEFIGLAVIAGYGLFFGSIFYLERSAVQARENLVREYNSAVAEGRENRLGTFNIYSERTRDNRNCSFFGADIDGDGNDDIRRMKVHLGRGMSHNEYFDLRNK